MADPEDPMQRMIVGLVLILTLAVSVLAVVSFGLNQRLDARLPRHSAEESARRASSTSPLADRLTLLEGQLDELREEVVWLRREQEVLRNARLSAARISRGEGDAAPSPGPERPPAAGPGEEVPGFGADAQRGPDGDFQITAEEEAYFMAIQRRVERRRRIDGLTRSLLRRVDRMVTNGEIGELRAETRRDVERAIRDYVSAGEDIVARYVRQPSEEVAQLSSDEKREAMRIEREAVITSARQALANVLGPQDASAVSEKTFQNPWGSRLKNRRGGLRGGVR
jgi:hypothetical protein